MRFKTVESIQQEKQQEKNRQEIFEFFWFGVKQQNIELEQLAWNEWKTLEVTRLKDRLEMLIPDKTPEAKRKTKI